jgi:carbamoyltransferase
MTHVATPLPAEMPLRIGDPEDFARVRTALRQSGFEESAVYQALSKAGFCFEDDPLASPTRSAGVTEFGPLIELFVEQKDVPRKQLDHFLAADTITSLLNLDLVRISESDPSKYYSPVVLYPINGLLIASDYYKPPQEGRPQPVDSVYPALHSFGLLRVISRTRVSSALDLCSGTAVFGLAMSKDAEQVLASDITARSTHFGLFNRCLNGCTNVRIVQGDLYEAAGGESFDRIVAHPPYMPTFVNAGVGQTWRDAGPSGEELVEAIIRSLPKYLRSGGEFFATFMARESDQAPVEQRARAWLDGSPDEFDVIFASKKQLSIRQVISVVQEKSHSPTDIDPAKLEASVRALGFSHYVSGIVGIRRHNAAGKPWTFRTELSRLTDECSFRHAFDWNGRRADPVSNARRLRPALAPGLSVTETCIVDHGKLKPEKLILEADWPFHHTVKTDMWIRAILEHFSGRSTVGEVYAKLTSTHTLPSGLSLAHFVDLVSTFVGRGYLDVTTSS